MTRPCVLALGFFDGVHIGHGGLLRRTRETADRLGVPAAALTFDTHPDTLVSGHSVPLLNTPEDRAALMRKYYGIDEVLTLHFDRETMTQPWERFAEETLLGRYHAVHLVCGHDFRFGDRGAGNPEKLAAFCAQRGIGFTGGILVGNPVPEEYALDHEYMERIINVALQAADEANVHGKNITPFLLAKVKELTGGESFETNVQLALNNARCAARIAAALCELKKAE